MVPALFSFSGKSETHGRVSARTVRKICTRVGEAVRCHPGNRFFTPFHYLASCLFQTECLPPVQNDNWRKGVIMREALSVIRSEREGSVPVVRKAVRR